MTGLSDTFGVRPIETAGRAIKVNDVASEQEAVFFEVEKCRLWGEMHRHSRPAKQTTGVLLLNSDDGCRLGPYGLWRLLAREVSSLGFPCMRFDYRGCGDSEGPERSPSGVVGLSDTIAAERVLREQTQVSHVVLVGICYGAEIALLAARCLASVRGVVACSTGRYVTTDGFALTARNVIDYGRVYAARCLEMETWRRLFNGCIHGRMIWDGFVQRLSRRRWRQDRNGAAAAHKLVRSLDEEGSVGRRTSPQLFIYGGADPLTREYLPHYRREGETLGLDRRFVVIPQADHNFAATVWAREVVGHVVEFIQEVAHRLDRAEHEPARDG